jgi:hypothetical protein
MRSGQAWVLKLQIGVGGRDAPPPAAKGSEIKRREEGLLT